LGEEDNEQAFRDQLSAFSKIRELGRTSIITGAASPWMLKVFMVYPAEG
jgi:hypothetical protein